MKLIVTTTLSLFTLLSFQGPATTVVAESNDDDCGLYLAVSSTSDLDAVKWGIFAGVTIPSGSLVGEPDLAIQTHNLLGNAHSDSPEDQSSDPTVRSVELFEEYIWVPDTTGGGRDLKKPGRMVSAIMGAGFLGAYNGKLTNTEWYHGGAFFRDAIGEAERGVGHPGRGASTHFYNVTLVSTEDIVAGSEIFMDYGSNWEDEDDEEEDDELKKRDYTKIDQFVKQMTDFFSKHEEELTGVAKAEIYDFLVRDIINAAVGPKKGKKIHALLPKNPDELVEVQKVGSLVYSEPKASQRTEWLKQNGLCMDHLTVGASSVPHAGRGAFAKRPIQKGNLIAPMPMMHAPEGRSMMNMYEVTRGTDADGDRFMHRKTNEIIGQQLLLNYAFGHEDSSLLLLPAGTLTSFINHAPTATGKEEKKKKKGKTPTANAKLIFSDHPEMQAKPTNFRELTPKEMLKEDHLGIIMEVVALRDIEQGEEIFLDYGDDWQKAWDAHVETWNQKVKRGDLPNPWPTRALDMNQEYKTKQYPTASELEQLGQYPDTVRQVCFLVVQAIKGGKDENTKQWGISKKGNVIDDDNIFDCSIQERFGPFEDEQPSPIGGLPYNYTVTWTDKEDQVVQVLNVPHSAIVFIDQPNTSDQFVKEAFRHYIAIPDDVFPQVWKDRLVNNVEVDDESKTKSSDSSEHEEL